MAIITLYLTREKLRMHLSVCWEAAAMILCDTGCVEYWGKVSPYRYMPIPLVVHGWDARESWQPAIVQGDWVREEYCPFIHPYVAYWIKVEKLIWTNTAWNFTWFIPCFTKGIKEGVETFSIKCWDFGLDVTFHTRQMVNIEPVLPQTLITKSVQPSKLCFSAENKHWDVGSVSLHKKNGS